MNNIAAISQRCLSKPMLAVQTPSTALTQRSSGPRECFANIPAISVPTNRPPATAEMQIPYEVGEANFCLVRYANPTVIGPAMQKFSTAVNNINDRNATSLFTYF